MIAFVRHGQTAVNRDGRLQGRLDAPLSELGAQQAAALGHAFATAEIARVVSSPLQRACDTAASIAAPHGLTVVPDEHLIELDYGAWDGLPLGDVPPDAWVAWQRDPNYAPPGGERLTDVTARIDAFVRACSFDGLTIAVSHVSPIKAAVCLALGAGEEASWRMQLDVASITRIGKRPNGRYYLATFNETVRTPQATG